MKFHKKNPRIKVVIERSATPEQVQALEEAVNEAAEKMGVAVIVIVKYPEVDDGKVGRVLQKAG